MRKHYVTFESPGMLFSESTIKLIAEWDPRLAVSMAERIVERHGAKPYGFYFSTRLAAAPVSDGEGGTLEVEEKEIARSGVHYLGGRLRTVDEVRRDAKLDEAILLSNMEANDYPIVVENTNSWKVTRPFGERDVIVGPDGVIVERGDASERVAYRAEKLAEHRAEMEKRYGS